MLNYSDKEIIIDLCRNTPIGFKMPELYINESVAYIINEQGEKEMVDCQIIKNMMDKLKKPIFASPVKLIESTNFSDIDSDCDWSQISSNSYSDDANENIIALDTESNSDSDSEIDADIISDLDSDLDSDLEYEYI